MCGRLDASHVWLPRYKIKKVELALGPLQFDMTTDCSVQGLLRVVKQGLDAWLYQVPNVMDLDQFKMSCCLNVRSATVYCKLVWPEKTMLEADALTL